MYEFNHYIPVNGEMITFTFRRVFTVEGMRYLVTASDFAAQFYMFYMQNEGNSWSFCEPEKLPAWLLALGSNLDHCVLSH